MNIYPDTGNQRWRTTWFVDTNAACRSIALEIYMNALHKATAWSKIETCIWQIHVHLARDLRPSHFQYDDSMALEVDCFNILNMISISSDFEGLQMATSLQWFLFTIWSMCQYVLIIEASCRTVGENQNRKNRDDAEMRAEAGWRIEYLMQCIAMYNVIILYVRSSRHFHSSYAVKFMMNLWLMTCFHSLSEFWTLGKIYVVCVSLSEIATSPPAPQRVWSRTHRRSWKRCGRLCTSSTLGGKGLVFSVPKTTGVELSQGRAYSGLNINDIEWSKCMESSVEGPQLFGNLGLLQFS